MYTAFGDIFSEASSSHTSVAESEALMMKLLIEQGNEEINLYRSVLGIERTESISASNEPSMEADSGKKYLMHKMFLPLLLKETRNLSEQLFFLKAKQELIEKQGRLIKLILQETDEYELLHKSQVDRLIQRTKIQLGMLSKKWKDESNNITGVFCKRKPSVKLFSKKEDLQLPKLNQELTQRNEKENKIRKLRETYVVKINKALPEENTINQEKESNSNFQGNSQQASNQEIQATRNNHESVVTNKTIQSMSLIGLEKDTINLSMRPSSPNGDISMTSGTNNLKPLYFVFNKKQTHTPVPTTNMTIEVPENDQLAKEPEEPEEIGLSHPKQAREEGEPFVFELKLEEFNLPQQKNQLDLVNTENIQISPKNKLPDKSISSKPTVPKFNLKFKGLTEEEMDSGLSSDSDKIPDKKPNSQSQKDPTEYSNFEEVRVNPSHIFSGNLLRKPKVRGSTHQHTSSKEGTYTKYDFITGSRVSVDGVSLDTPSFNNAEFKKGKSIYRESFLKKKSEQFRHSNSIKLSEVSDKTHTNSKDQESRKNLPESLTDKVGGESTPHESNQEFGSQKVLPEPMGSENSSRLNPTLKDSSQNSSEERHREWQIKSGIVKVEKPKSRFNKLNQQG